MQTQSRTAGATTCPFRTLANPPDRAERPSAPGEAEATSAAIARWLSTREADRFPFDAVVAEFHRVGKHVVGGELLEALAAARAALPEARDSEAGSVLLSRFLDTALDKWDGRYANPTYLALSLLPLPTVGEPDQDIATTEGQFDRLFVHLVADVARFEIAAADGTTDLLPHMRPDARTTAKRCRLALQIVGPAARRLGLGDGIDVDDPITGARRLCENLAADLSIEDRRTLQLTMLPVSLIHDEYQFIRALQAFESTFALIAVQLDRAIRALSAGEHHEATEHIRAAEQALREAAPLFSLVATMQVEAFHTFREFTDGASAIQSRNYKLVESLCRRPGKVRLDSAAYQSVPEVRQRVLAGQMTMDDVYQEARAAGCLTDELEAAMRAFAATLQRWRRTHHGIAARMLGEKAGTGYTEGSAYLKSVQSIPVFLSLAPDEDSEPEAESEARLPGQSREAIAARGGCPFAAGMVILSSPDQAVT
jgi:tryptophan 2,3-dioxygenase